MGLMGFGCSKRVAKKVANNKTVYMNYRLQLRTSRPDRNGLCALYFVINLERPKWIPSGLKLHPNVWNQRRQELTQGADLTTQKRFTDIKYNALQYAQLLAFEKRPFQEREFVQALSAGKLDDITNPTLQQLIDQYTQLKPLSLGRYQHYRQLKNELQECFGTIRIKDFTYKAGLQLQKFFKERVSENTATQKMHRIKAILHFARDLQIITEDPLRPIKLKGYSNRKTVLSIEELQLLQALYDGATLPPHQHNALRVFLFACYTGMRISDIRRFTPAMVQGNSIRLVQQKTEQAVIIPLTDFSKTIIAEGFNIRTGQTLNRDLVPVAKLAGINKHLTMHVGRHTFATVSLRLGMDLLTVSRILGHRSIRQTQSYLHLLDDHLQEQMSAWNKLQVVHRQAAAG